MSSTNKSANYRKISNLFIYQFFSLQQWQNDQIQVSFMINSEDKFQINIYIDVLEKININSEENDNNNNGNDDESDIKENILVENNILSSEEWEEVSESDVPSITINFAIYHQTTSNIKELIDYFTLYFASELVDNIIKKMNYYTNEKIRNKKLSHNLVQYYQTRISSFHRHYSKYMWQIYKNIGLLLPIISANFLDASFEETYAKYHLSHPNNLNETRYLFSIFLYFDISIRILLHLYEKLLNKILDKDTIYTTSIILAEELLKMKCYLIIALRKNNIKLFAWKDKNGFSLQSKYETYLFFYAEIIEMVEKIIFLGIGNNNRLNNKLHIPNVEERKRDCIVCSDRKTPGKRRQTTYYCETCIN
ncbi:LOW QUALITY PROTEIN: piggyBac transposable element-derived protein 4-like [Vespula squamosa]|uniref:PiggyBac transposable element-derived protein 4-like n=1 Tax=Vespula squamosa TaxID=30214 RepID=A0ABD2AK45_VESSQ